MSIFDRYVIKEHVAPFFFAFSVIMFVLILKLMLDLMDLLISKGIGIVILGKLLAYNLAWMIALVVPMSVLVSTVMAFGRMGAAGEITAMKAAGISMYRILVPVLVLAVMLTAGMAWFNNVVLPEANHRAGSLRRAVSLAKPMIALKNREGQFVNDEDIPFVFRVENVDDTTEEMYGVTLVRQERGGEANTNTVIVAESGHFIPSSDRLELLLINGEIHRMLPGNDERYVRSPFHEFRYIIKNIQFGLSANAETVRNDRSMNTPMMREKISYYSSLMTSLKQRLKTLDADDPNLEAKVASLDWQIVDMERKISSYLVEIHKKNSIPVASIVFVLIGSALGMLVRRSGASIGIGLSIGFFMLYYMFLIGGETAADRMILNPWLAMWAPNIVLGPLGIALFLYAARR